MPTGTSQQEAHSSARYARKWLVSATACHRHLTQQTVLAQACISLQKTK